jgi:hypothetical protein
MTSIPINNQLKVILEEIKESYKINLDIKTTLEDKARNIIIVSGLLIPILFGLNSSIYLFVKDMTWLLFGGLIMNLIALFAAVVSSILLKHTIVLGNLMDNDYEKMKKMSEDELTDAFIILYRNAIKDIATKNVIKSTLVFISQGALVLSLSLFSYLIIIKLVAA